MSNGWTPRQGAVHLWRTLKDEVKTEEMDARFRPSHGLCALFTQGFLLSRSSTCTAAREMQEQKTAISVTRNPSIKPYEQVSRPSQESKPQKTVGLCWISSLSFLRLLKTDLFLCCFCVFVCGLHGFLVTVCVHDPVEMSRCSQGVRSHHVGAEKWKPRPYTSIKCAYPPSISAAQRSISSSLTLPVLWMQCNEKHQPCRWCLGRPLSAADPLDNLDHSNQHVCTESWSSTATALFSLFASEI